MSDNTSCLRKPTKDREHDKFGCTSDGETAVRVIPHKSSGGPAPLLAATAVRITNLSIPLATTEVAHTLLTDVKKLYVTARGKVNLQFSYTIAESGTKYISIPKNTAYSESDINLSSGVLYIQSDTATTTVEIKEWN